MYGLPFLGGMTIILGAYYMLKMYQQVMLGNEYKTFKDVTFKEGFALVVIIAVLFFFWDVSKPDLITQVWKIF
jgi:NADH-quinone oxidoreductase subunit M